jgi:peptide chain release factor 1
MSVILEIRAGAGGDEAGLFASELLRMYQKFAGSQGWQFSLTTPLVAEIRGENIYQLLKNESGVHRVQRIPKTEKSGRIHTSTVTVAVLPKVSTSQVELNPKDLKIETFRSSGPGGQHMQKSESAVRITHLPTGVTASCQDERSQLRNKQKAEEILRSRLYQEMVEQKKSRVDELRREQIGRAGREEKIRTYNFPQNRVTDHRLGKSWHNLKGILDGNLSPILEAFPLGGIRNT